MYEMQISDGTKFVDEAQKSGKPVRVTERAVAFPVRESGGIVVHVALERFYSVEVKDELQGDTRLIFTEYLVEQDEKLPFETSIYPKLKKVDGLRVIEVNRISQAA